MIYHTYSMVGYMLWIRYALMKLKPFTSLKEIYATYLESPGTKAYSVAEAKLLFKSLILPFLICGSSSSVSLGVRVISILLKLSLKDI